MPRDEATVDRIFAGNLDDLPPLSSKVVRIFTSSTFTDMLMERNTLMEYVYPKIKEYCREKHGLEYQVVDMRWGVRDEMTDEHMTTALCMNELRGCQKYSMGPNFIYFGAQKYGYRPIPSEIDTAELELLRDALVSMGNDVSLLDRWYRKDSNKVPPESILLPISTHLVHFLNKRQPKLQARDAGIWWGTLAKLQLMLRKAAKALYQNDKFDEEQMHNYRMAVTEREVRNGCISMPDDYVKDHVIIYTRILRNINLQNLKRASAFIDIMDRHVDQEAQDFLTYYRDVLAKNKMLKNKGIYKRYEIEWIGREGLAPETHDAYLKEFINHFYKNTLKLIDRAMRKEDNSPQGKIVTELLQHLHQCKNNCDVFYGREEELKKMKDYITGPSTKPFVLFGAGGSGKSALLSKTALQSLKEWLAPAVPLLMCRFCGTTPNSTALGPLLKSICQQISYTYMLPFEDIPDDTVPVTAFLKELLKLATAERPLLIFLDSVDELTGSQDANKMSWLPLKIPDHCKIVVSCTYEEGNPALMQDLKFLRAMIEDDNQFLEVTALGSELAWRVMKLWMTSAGRTLNNYQWRVVANALDHCTLPIFCKLVLQEVCRWKSYFEPEKTVLMTNVQDSVFQLFQRVENKHGWMLVSHALAYVTASKNGVSEPEIEDFISLDDKVLDDIYQYHLPPTRRIPPLLWTRVRSDLPGYLADSEADGVCVINYYHKQFKHAAKQRYFLDDTDYLYFHSYMSDYFLGTYGGGILKPFRYTEIQKHTFNLKSKDDNKDRQVPAMPLAYYNRQGKLTRYNLRKFTELPFQLVRCFRYKDLYDNVLFNYQWLYNKMCALPLPEVLGDFEDAIKNIRLDPHKKDTIHKEISLVADSLRLGGAILKFYPGMLSAQLVGRLLPEIENSENIRNLLRQCDEEGIKQNALVPTYHCMHTPGGPLKYSLEGHQFAIFAMKLTSDNRYIISCSNKFITFDVVTSDLARQVYPKVEGLMIGLELSPDNKFAAAYTNNNQTILLNTLISEFFIIDNPLGDGETVLGLVLLDTHLVVYGQFTWCIFDLRGKLLDTKKISTEGEILSLKMLDTLDSYSIISWTGDITNPRIILETMRKGVSSEMLVAWNGIAMNKKQTQCFICEIRDKKTVCEYNLVQGVWKKKRNLQENNENILMLDMSTNENWCYATILNGFKLWKVENNEHQELYLPNGVRNISKKFNESNELYLPNGVRNISKKFNESNNCILSAGDRLAVAGIRQELFVWSMSTGELVNQLNAHFQRIVEIKSLVVGSENSVLTSSIDRSIKVWNLNYIFEKEHHIDKHELTIDSLSISTKAGIAVVVTRSCIGIWDFMTGKLKFRLANAALGAIVTHALVNKDGTYIVAAESGDVLYWNLENRQVIFQEKQPNIQQIFYYKNETRCVVVSRRGERGNYTGICTSRSVPEGVKQWEFEYPFLEFKNVVMTPDELNVVCYGFEKMKNHIYIHAAKTGEALNKILIKYTGFKEVTKIVALPDKPSVVALIDVEKGNLIDIIQKRFLKSIPFWDGTCTKDGKFGLYAPATGGMDMLDLRTGKVCKTLIPKVAEGIFDVVAVFNATNEYVLYYHSGKKTIRAFRRKNGEMIANFRVQADLKGMETTTDGRCVVLGMGDGSMTTLTIADPEKDGIRDYLKSLPSRNPEGAGPNGKGKKSCSSAMHSPSEANHGESLRIMNN
ncbi:NACHT and WD repeat domain-containing protein 2 [Eurytemora carolleeae]|uniref:NACHT and WD repeat domain-containing protein 2 n=1 Tax=Eurytemora carolleeae TaxID=1294199 RepID=UPI000C75BF7B|nr:NACHT and WD repeat domain-containing protein 2 [Eurytemora carolleeae]|eukprot:XP_023324790.1 NACHT and WD repeat domain-containing protein 2-like [Eurytemora affinis]